MSSSNSSRPFRIVIWGATGYTGQLCCEYIAKSKPFVENQYVLAARNESKLKTVINKMAAMNKDYSATEMLIGNSRSTEDLRRICSSADLLINCVGPFREHGEPVVRACLDARTHYIDISGETAFIRTMIAKYSEQAKKRNLLFVMSAGWDCVPADIGALYTERQFAPGRAVSVHGYFTPPGFLFSVISNGTYRSLIQSLYNQKEDARLKKRHAVNSQTKLKPRSPKGIPGRKIHQNAGTWALPFPTADPWVTRFSRQEIDRQWNSLSEDQQSSTLATLGTNAPLDESLPNFSPVHQNFSYGHFLRAGSIFNMIILAICFLMLNLFSKFKLGVQILYKFKSDGQGLDAETRAVSSSQHAMVGYGYTKDIDITSSGDRPLRPNKIVKTVMNTPDMYTSTAIFVVEGADTILSFIDAGSLSYRAGVTTPGAGLGLPYLNRLIDHPQLNFSIVSE